MIIVYLEFDYNDDMVVAEVEIGDDYDDLEVVQGYGETKEEACEDLIDFFDEVYESEDAADLTEQLIDLAERKGAYVLY